MKEEITKIDITWQAILKVFAVIFLFYVAYLIRSVLVWMLLGLIISILLNPWIRALEKRKIPRSVATIAVYLGLLLVLAFFLWLAVPPLALEAHYFSENYGDYFKKIPEFFSQMGINSFDDIATLNSSLEGSLVKVSTNLLGFLSSVFGTLFGAITVFALALFMSIEEKEIVKGIRIISPKRFEEDVLNRWQRSQDHVVAWFGSKVLCCVAVAVMTFILCVSLNLHFSLSLSLLAGLLNFIPVFGPVVSAVLIALVALMDSWTKVALVIIFSIIIQQIESNVLTPILTKKLTGLPNTLVLVSIIVGGILGGVIGAVLAIPFAGIIFEGLKDYFNYKKRQED